MSRHVPSNVDSATKVALRLRTFTKGDLIKLVPQKFEFGAHQLSENVHTQSKRSIINILIVELLKMRTSIDQMVLQLDMLYIQNYSKRKVWQIFKMTNVQEDFDADFLSRPEAFMNCLEMNLSRGKFQCKVLSEFYQEGMWSVVQLRPMHSRGRKKEISFKFFLLHFPQLPYILYSDIKLPIFTFIQTALCLTFGTTKLRHPRLSSRNVGTILQLALQKEGCKFEGGPMPAIIQIHHKPITEVSFNEVPNVINEDSKNASRTTKYINKLYGKFQQPPLESLVVRVKSQFNGNENEEIGPVKCQLVFSGSNVLEGIRELVQGNVIERPLHYSFERLPQLGCNRFYLVEQ